jgi:hypothetical protein
MADFINYCNYLENCLANGGEYFSKKVIEEFNIDVLNDQIQEAQFNICISSIEENKRLSFSIITLSSSFEELISHFEKMNEALYYYYDYCIYKNFLIQSIQDAKLISPKFNALDWEEGINLRLERVKRRELTQQDLNLVKDFQEIRNMIFEERFENSPNEASDVIDRYCEIVHKVVRILRLRLHGLKLLLFYCENTHLSDIPIIYNYESSNNVPIFFIKPYIYEKFIEAVRKEPFAIRANAFSFLFHAMKKDNFISPLVKKETYRLWVIKEFEMEFSRVLDLREIKTTIAIMEDAYKQLKVKFRLPDLYFD